MESYKDIISANMVGSTTRITQNFFVIVPPGGADQSNSPPAAIVQALQSAIGSLNGSNVGEKGGETFSVVADEWFKNNHAVWAHSYSLRLKGRLEAGLLEVFGARPIATIGSLDILEAVRRIEARGARETARRVLRIASAVFRYAVATGRCTRDPTADLKGALKPPTAVRHRASLSAKEVPRFLNALARYEGDELTKLALDMVLRTFVRTGELRFARWSEIEDLDGARPLWRIPAERMKMRKAHLVPLSNQVVLILKKLRELNPVSDRLFPASTRTGVISENTLLFALYRMGYRRRATVHGFRSTASTILNEAQFNRDWIELQLAHADGSVRGVYNGAEWLPGRREMLQWWSDYLDIQAH